ncbi:hypothetical protein BIQ82_23530, partial [Escherichia coli]
MLIDSVFHWRSFVVLISSVLLLAALITCARVK